MLSNKIFILMEANEPINVVFTSLRAACKEFGVSYQMAVRGKRNFGAKRIVEASLSRCKRGGRFAPKEIEAQRMETWNKNKDDYTEA